MGAVAPDLGLQLLLEAALSVFSLPPKILPFLSSPQVPAGDPSSPSFPHFPSNQSKSHLVWEALPDT